MKKGIAAGLLALFAAAELFAAGPKYFSGSGGRGMSVAVLVPEGRGLSRDEAYLTTLVQGVFVADIAKYSAISVLDRQNLERVLSETESGIYAAGSDFMELGNITQTTHALSGSVTRTRTAYALSITVTDTKTGVTKASYTGDCTIAELDNLSGIKKASEKLLEGMDVKLTDAAKAELSGASAESYVGAQTALARGITAEKSGNLVDALIHYYEAEAYNEKFGDEAAWLKSLSQAIKTGNAQTTIEASGMSGSIEREIRNEMARRENERLLKERWEAILAGAHRYTADYFKTRKIAAIVYDPNLAHRIVNYENRVIELSFTVRAVAFTKKEAPLFKTLRDIQQGLDRAQKDTEWRLDFYGAVFGGGVYGFKYGDFVFNYSVQGLVLNGRGKEIGKFSQNLGTTIAAPSVVGATITKNSNKVRKSKIVFCEYNGEDGEITQTVSFQTTQDNITDSMTVKITGVYENGGADNVLANIPVMTESQYALKAGLRAMKRQEYERFRLGVSAEGLLFMPMLYDHYTTTETWRDGGTPSPDVSTGEVGSISPSARLGAELGVGALFAEAGFTFGSIGFNLGTKNHYDGAFEASSSFFIAEAGGGYRFLFKRPLWGKPGRWWGLNVSGGAAFIHLEESSDKKSYSSTNWEGTRYETMAEGISGYDALALYVGAKVFLDAPRHYVPTNVLFESIIGRIYFSTRLYIPLTKQGHYAGNLGVGWIFYPIRM